MKTDIEIRPHHFVDILESFGQGKRIFLSHPTYGHAVHTISKRLLHERNISVKIILDIDDICSPCVHNVAGRCDDTIDTSFRPKAPSLKNDWMLLIDPRWCEKLSIQIADQFRAHELCERIRDRIGIRDFMDVYREIPPHIIEQRYANLMKGLESYLV